MLYSITAWDRIFNVMVAAAYIQGANWETDVSLPIYPL
jgi:hypothetical protein